MLEVLNGRASERKLRQLVCACHRRSGGYVHPPAHSDLVLVSEVVDLVEQIESDANSMEIRSRARREFTLRAALSSSTEAGNIAGVGQCLY